MNYRSLLEWLYAEFLRWLVDGPLGEAAGKDVLNEKYIVVKKFL